MTAHFGRRLRKGATTTAVAAAAVAALAASQAPGAGAGDQGRQPTTDSTSSPDANADSATGNSPYYTDLPPLHSPKPSPTDGTSVTPGPTESGIPATVLDAYKKAAAALDAAKPGCNLPWQLLAAIGKVESGQARGGRVHSDGTTISPIIGPQLDGNGFALIKDTDDGVYDGNSRYDNAVGPMQFIPSTWAWAGRDGNGDGKKDPNNIYDAALAAGHYLCRFGWDLSVQADMNRAILSYNHSQDYLHTVLSWLEYYRKGSHEIPDGTGALPGDRSDGGPGSGAGPSIPSTPSTPRPEKPGRPGGGGQTPKPPTTTPPAPPPSTPAPTPTDTVHHLENAGTGTLTAMTGDAFTGRVSTRAETEDGKPVATVRIRFTITGSTGATFSTGETVATVATNRSGVAVSPALLAGEKAGGFTIRAAVVGRFVPVLTYRASVTERTADALTRTDTADLTCVAGGEFAGQVEARATFKGAVAKGVAATATLVKSADDPAVNDKGPYFKDAAGNTVRTLTGLKTDVNGMLKLPKLYADDTSGTYVLRITTAGGATLTVNLTVTAPATPEPTPSTSPSPTPSTSPSPTPSTSPSPTPSA